MASRRPSGPLSVQLNTGGVGWLAGLPLCCSALLEPPQDERRRGGGEEVEIQPSCPVCSVLCLPVLTHAVGAWLFLHVHRALRSLLTPKISSTCSRPVASTDRQEDRRKLRVNRLKRRPRMEKMLPPRQQENPDQLAGRRRCSQYGAVVELASLRSRSVLCQQCRKAPTLEDRY